MNYIIGSGLTALIAKHFHPEYKTIAPEQSILPELFYLWDTEYTRKFCDEFNYEYKEKEVSIKTFGENVNAYNSVTHKPIGNKPCEGKKYFKSLEVKFELPQPDIIDTIRRVESKVMWGREQYNYDKLIWTAHLDKTNFNDKKYLVNYYPISYLNIYTKQYLFDEDFAYFHDSEMLEREIYRASRQPYGYCFEIARLMSNLAKTADTFHIRKFFNADKFIKTKLAVNPRGFVSGESPINTDEIMFAGRYAESNHEIKASDVIERFYKERDKNV